MRGNIWLYEVKRFVWGTTINEGERGVIHISIG